MAAVFDVSILWTVFQNVGDFLMGRADRNSANTIAAHKAINSAFIETYDYLRNRNGQYLPKPELAHAWNEASAAVMKVDMGLGELLSHKSRFWLDPQLYISLGSEKEIIQIDQLVEEMEQLRMKM